MKKKLAGWIKQLSFKAKINDFKVSIIRESTQAKSSNNTLSKNYTCNCISHEKS